MNARGSAAGSTRSVDDGRPRPPHLARPPAGDAAAAIFGGVLASHSTTTRHAGRGKETLTRPAVTDRAASVWAGRRAGGWAGRWAGRWAGGRQSNGEWETETRFLLGNVQGSGRQAPCAPMLGCRWRDPPSSTRATMHSGQAADTTTTDRPQATLPPRHTCHVQLLIRAR